MIKGLYVNPIRKSGRPVRWYVYAWRGGPLLLRIEGPRDPRETHGLEIAEAYRKAIAERTTAPRDSTLELIERWRRSQEWKALATSTRRTWNNLLERIEEKWGKVPLRIWSDPRMVRKVVAWRDSLAATPRTADNAVTVLRALLEWARLRGLVTVNPAAGIPKLYRGADRADILWTDADIAAFRKEASPQVAAALDLACNTGLRRGDLASLAWADVGDTAIVKLAEKRSRGKRRRAVIPITRELRTLLASLRKMPRAEGVETVLVNVFGQPWSADGLSHRIIAARDKANGGAGIRHEDGRTKHLHDCRGTYATRLILAGFTDEQAARVLGWSPEEVARIRDTYVDHHATIVALADRLDRGDCQTDCQTDQHASRKA